MPTNLRLSLAIFQVGFAVECASGFVALVTHAAQLPFQGLLLLVTPAFTACGILFLWIGRHEWNELHRTRVRYTNLAFAASLAAVALAVAPLAYLATNRSYSPPEWLSLEFGIAAALVIGVTFLTYGLVAAHLVGRTGTVAMALALGWAAVLTVAIGAAIAPQLAPIARAVTGSTASLGPTLSPITMLDALLAFSYLGFFLAFVDAHFRVARGLDPAPS
ncbi:MAG: hypothetical protein L3K00_02475 [Thermoplasmata archaeon]|nr:hypothetical protein [Thermoplasmata archaeon]